MHRLIETEARTLAIAVTAFVSKAEQARGLAAGFQAFLPKPVDLWGLVERAACLALRES